MGYQRRVHGHEFLEKELKVTKAVITSSKLSTTSDILWIQVDNEQTAIDIQKQTATLRREARAIMYPPPEYFRTIKSVEHNCNEQKKTNKDLRYTVRIGTDNIELWTKYLREPQYTQQPLDTYGEIEPPNLERIIITPNFGQSPPKGRGKPHNYSILQQQTPLGIEQEKTSEAEPTQNKPQGEIEAVANRNALQTTTGETETGETRNKNPQTTTGETETGETRNRNLNQLTQEGMDTETASNLNQLQERATQNTDRYQAIMKDIQNDININKNILEEQTHRDTTIGQNPNQNTKQQQVTLKRNIDNNEGDETLPKRLNMIDVLTDDEMITNDITQSPGWPENSTTETSQIEGHNMDLENLLGKMIDQATTPITPIRRRTRSQEKDDQLNNITESRTNQGKNHIKGIQRINKSGNRGKNQKPNANNKAKETNKEHKQDNSNKIDNELEIAASTPI